jgi:hypothetical protein
LFDYLNDKKEINNSIKHMDDKEVKSTLQQMKANSDKLAASIKKYCDDYPDDEICKPGFLEQPSKYQGYKANGD